MPAASGPSTSATWTTATSRSARTSWSTSSTWATCRAPPSLRHIVSASASTAGGDTLNDAFAQLGDLGTDHVYIHDTSVYLLAPQSISFGASFGPGQDGKSWEARRIAWHARSADVVSDAHLTNLANGCVAGATCDYGIGTHTYEYDDALAFPADPWRSLPGLAEDDPDALPVVQ